MIKQCDKTVPSMGNENRICYLDGGNKKIQEKILLYKCDNCN